MIRNLPFCLYSLSTARKYGKIDSFFKVMLPGKGVLMGRAVRIRDGRLERNPNKKAVAELVQKIKDNDNNSIQLLVEWCHDRILLKIQSELSGFPALWEDVFWETIEGLVVSIKNGKYEQSGATLAAYVFGIVKNKIHDTRNKEHKNKLNDRLVNELDDKHIFPAKDIKFDLMGFNKHTRQMESILTICLKNMRKSHRAHVKAIEMFYLEDLSLKEIATRMNLTVQKVIDLKTYGLKKLRQCLDGYRD